MISITTNVNRKHAVFWWFPGGKKLGNIWKNSKGQQLSNTEFSIMPCFHKWWRRLIWLLCHGRKGLHLSNAARVLKCVLPFWGFLVISRGKEVNLFVILEVNVEKSLWYLEKVILKKVLLSCSKINLWSLDDGLINS